MRTLFLVAVLLGVVLCAGRGKVIDITKTDAHRLTTGSWFVKFYAPWCGHCKNMAPEYEKVAAALPELNVAEVDCTKEGNDVLCGIFNVKSYPTLKYIHDGKAIPYPATLAREFDDMERWVKKKAPEEAAGGEAFTLSGEFYDASEASRVRRERHVENLSAHQAFHKLKKGAWFLEITTNDALAHNAISAEFAEAAEKLAHTSIKCASYVVDGDGAFLSALKDDQPAPRYVYVNEGEFYPIPASYSRGVEFASFVMTGHRETRRFPLPTNPSVLAALDEPLDKLRHWIDYHALPAMGITGGIGLVVGLIFGRLCG